jgi:hypothetical protein
MRYATTLLAATVALALVVAGTAPAKSPRVLRVGKHGTYRTIQAAVNAAHRGDWILIAPGDYKERVLIRKSGLHLRGMSRRGVIVDGTKSGRACSSRARDQVFNRGDKGNGIEVFKANAVSIENLTVCNFLGEGNQIWWNGGDGSGKIGMSSWYGSYLTATSTYFNRKKPQATYGLFASNAKGPARLTNSYASNMNDAAVYVGACHPCNATLDHLKGEFNRLGYSGTNSSGVILQNSEFSNNFAGITTDSENNDDAPSPQLGSTFTNNFVHDNNNPNVPSTTDGLRIVGVGIIVVGGRHNVISDNRVENNGAWGVLLAPFPDTRKPPKVAHCQGGVKTKFNHRTACFFDDFANQVFSNKLKHNGFFGNATNGDLGDVSGQNTPGNCWHDNVRTDGTQPTAEPSDLQTAHTDCNASGHGDDLGSELAAQALCDSELLSKCKRDAKHRYPRTTKVRVHRLPKLRGMKDPCSGVPVNPWCPKRAKAAG